MTLGWKVFCAFIGFATVSVVAVIGSARWTIGQGGDLEDFVRLAAVWFTVLPAAFTALMSFFLLRAQQASALEVENLKASWAAGIERLKSGLAANIELTKARLSRIGRACEEIERAAMQYYYALAALERGDRPLKDWQGADAAMVAASAFTNAFDPDLLSKWHAYWQYARHVKERGATADSAHARKQLWQKEAKAIGEHLEALLQDLHARANTLPGDLGCNEGQAPEVANSPANGTSSRMNA